MRIQMGLSLIVLAIACGKQKDQREFGSGVGALIPKEPYNTEDALPVEEIESKVLDEGVEAGELEKMSNQPAEKLPEKELPKTGTEGKTSPPGGKDPAQSGKGQTPPPPAKDPAQSEAGKTPPYEPKKPEPKAPQLPPEVKEKLAKCYAQWEKLPWDKETLIDIREFNLNGDRISRSIIEFGGAKPEVVFINVKAEKSIRKLDLALNNSKALYCVDISAAKKIDRLNLTYVCGSKLGVIDIEADKIKRAQIREVCPAP